MLEANWNKNSWMSNFLTYCSFSKNKKQRMMVRAAVLKMKDPKQIIRDMEKLDEMGKNV